MKLSLPSSIALSCLCALALHAAEPTQTLKVWPDAVPIPINDHAPERILPDPPNAKKVLRVEGVTDPTLQVYPAPKDKANGVGVIIAPGGGFARLALDLEGSEVAEFLNAHGVTAFVLKYRTSPPKSADPQLGPVMDAQRAISLIRSQAATYGLQPNRIGLLGISAGGQVSVIATTNHANRLYPAKDDVDKTSCRPDFLALVYPWHLQDTQDPNKLREDIRVDATTPPTFIAHAWDDPSAKVQGSLLLLLQLQTNKIPSEAHLYTKGGHGFGLRSAAVPCPTDWPERFAAWLETIGMVGKK